jgi:RHS repeat-associated protein
MLPDYGLLRFEYGYGHQRLRTTEFSSPQDSIVKEYVGNCEFVKTNGVVTSECTFLSGPLGVFAVLDSHVQPLGKGIYYVHPDHLGSWTTVTNRNGLVVQDVRFDPWGTPYYSDSTRLVEATSLLFDRGFTGHEHLLRYGLINMNGRVYDPVTSTFLSVDNYVQDPSSTQNFNRYAYCMNNPLKYTDPDGELAHWIIGALIGGVVNLATNWSKCKGVWDYFAAFGAGAANGVLSATVPVFGSIIGGALTGATNNLISQTGKNFSGFENINMNSFWNSVGYGGIAGLAGYGGGYLGAKAGNVLINGFGIVSPVTKGVVGGVMGGAAGGFASGSIIGGLQTGDFGQAMQLGWDGLLSGASIGAVSGGIAGYNHAKKNDLNPWTGVKNGNKIVIGRDMSNRVNPIAKDLKSETISEAWENTTKDNFHNDFLAGKQFNKRWIEIKIEEQYAIYDIGPGNNDIGINYGMELRTINQYENVFQVKVVIQTKYIRIITY